MMMLRIIVSQTLMSVHKLAGKSNLCMANVFSVTVNVYTQAGCTVNSITPIEGNSLFDINLGLVVQWHFVGLDRVNTALFTCTSSQTVQSPLRVTP